MGAPVTENELTDHHPWSHTWLGTDRFLARRFARPAARFLAIEAASGILLLIATVLALIWANFTLERLLRLVPERRHCS